MKRRLFEDAAVCYLIASGLDKEGRARRATKKRLWLWRRRRSGDLNHVGSPSKGDARFEFCTSLDSATSQ